MNGFQEQIHIKVHLTKKQFEKNYEIVTDFDANTIKKNTIKN